MMKNEEIEAKPFEKVDLKIVKVATERIVTKKDLHGPMSKLDAITAIMEHCVKEGLVILSGSLQEGKIESIVWEYEPEDHLYSSTSDKPRRRITIPHEVPTDDPNLIEYRVIWTCFCMKKADVDKYFPSGPPQITLDVMSRGVITVFEPGKILTQEKSE